MLNPYFRTEEEPDVEETPDPDEVAALLMKHALDMTYLSLESAHMDLDYEREPDYYAEDQRAVDRSNREAA